MTRAMSRLGELSTLFDAAGMRVSVLDALAVLAPTECSGCGAPDRALCPSCVRALDADVIVVEVERSDALPAHCALRYEGVARRVLLAVKESGRTDAAATLSRALEAALRSAFAALSERDIRDVTRAGIGIEIATIPSTRAAYRARGYHPTELILGHAGVRASRPLRAARQTADQAGLGLAARSANRSGSLVAARNLAGRTFILVDDIVTTGATLREARRAIQAAGGRVPAAVAIANTVLMKPER